MLGWLYRKLIGNFKGCKHEWEIYAKGSYKNDGRVTGHFYALKCKHCGDMKQKDFH